MMKVFHGSDHRTGMCQLAFYEAGTPTPAFIFEETPAMMEAIADHMKVIAKFMAEARSEKATQQQEGN
jgi:hypothetical protein